MTNKKKKNEIMRFRFIELIKVLLFYIFATILLAILAVIIIFIIYGIDIFLKTVDMTVIAIVVSAVFAIATLLLTKHLEMRLFKIKEFRNSSLTCFREYIDFLLSYEYDYTAIDLVKLLEYHKNFMFSVESEIINIMNNIVLALSKSDEDRIEQEIVNLLYELRKHLGYKEADLRKEALRKLLLLYPYGEKYFETKVDEVGKLGTPVEQQKTINTVRENGFDLFIDNNGVILTDKALLEKLRQKRLQFAQIKRLPAYCIISNYALVGLATYKPKTKEEFLRIKGLGEKIYDQYGASFIEEIKTK